MPPTTKEANLRLAGQPAVHFSTERCKPDGLPLLIKQSVIYTNQGLNISVIGLSAGHLYQ
jgi:hypothetical protein